MKVPTGPVPDRDGDGLPEPEWGEPPDAPRPPGRRRVWAERVAPLTARPGEWAKIADYGDDWQRATTTASNLRRRKVSLPEGDWEFVSRTGGIWARFIAPDASSPS